MDYAELMEKARPRLGTICKGCLVCNGRACGNKMPGPGAKGIGDTAIRNYEKWKEIRINMVGAANDPWRIPDGHPQGLLLVEFRVPECREPLQTVLRYA